MDYRLFFSTFLLIFVAELGDKTQLAAMARTAESGGAKWVVFAAASCALVLSTLVAVLFGSVLTRFVPERAIKITAAVLFILFGLLILHNTLAPARAVAAPEPPGIMSRAVLRLAAEFEESASIDYRALAEVAGNPAHHEVFTCIAREEDQHLVRLREAATGHEEVLVTGADESEIAARRGLRHNVAGDGEPAIEHAIRHEEATAGFYTELAGLTPVPALKQVFARLASEERAHARRLRELIQQER